MARLPRAPGVTALPAVPGASAPATPAVPSGSPVQSHETAAPPGILIVDEDGALVKVLRAALEPRYHVEPTPTGAAALESIARSPFDLVLLEHFIQEDTGWHRVSNLLPLSALRGHRRDSAPAVSHTLGRNAWVHRAHGGGPPASRVGPAEPLPGALARASQKAKPITRKRFENCEDSKRAAVLFRGESRKDGLLSASICI